MHLFLFLNDLAGRSSLFDGVARLFYISAVPLLATVVLAQLLFASDSATPRVRVALATVGAIVLALGADAALEALAAHLGLGTLSPRPWMTRRVNWLVVEPQDNSFPCVEVMLAAILSMASLTLNRSIGIACLVATAFFGLIRLFCGNNYFADVAVGALFGAALFVLCLSIAGVSLRRHETFMQGIASVGALLALVFGVYLQGALTPRFAAKLHAPWGAPVSQAPVVIESPMGVKAARTVLAEGEGIDPDSQQGDAEAHALAKREYLFLPNVENYLRGRLTPLSRPFTLLGVEVAPVKAGTSSYRCAALRFEVDPQDKVPARQDLRRLVAECAARLVKSTFAFDSQMQNVDVTAIVRGDGRQIANTEMEFTGNEVPVFTASIQRKNLVLAAPAWANQPGLDGGSWLRMRSRLYVNDKVLPPAPHTANEPLPHPVTTTGQTQSIPAATGSPSPNPTTKPLAVARTPKPVATQPTIVHPTDNPNLLLTPLPTATRSRPTPTSTSILHPLAAATPKGHIAQ